MCGTPAQPGKYHSVPWQVGSLDTNYIILGNVDNFTQKNNFKGKKKL
jgi:hypothetical protein